MGKSKHPLLQTLEMQDHTIRMQILNAVDKSLDRMTVSDICEKAGVSRQTFYRYFQSKYDIPCWHTLYCRQFYLNEVGRILSWHTGYYHHIRLLLQQYDFYTKSIQYTASAPFGQSPLPQHRKQVLLETLQDYRGITVSRNMLFVVEIFARLECEILNDWMRTGRTPNIEEWTNDLISVVPRKLFDALDIKDGDPPMRQ